MVDNISKLQSSDIQKQEFNFAELLGDIKYIKNKG